MDLETTDLVTAQPRVFCNAIDEELVNRTAKLEQRLGFALAHRFDAAAGFDPLTGQRRQWMGFEGEPRADGHGRR